MAPNSNSSWRPEPCLECRCHRDDVVFCTSTVCPNPQCDFQRGERLRIPANKCCPECISSQGSCQYEGLTYGTGSVWRPSPCSQCLCSGLGVTCSALSCPALDCPPDHRQFSPEGECCPQCVRNGVFSVTLFIRLKFLLFVFQHGEQWQKDSCTMCVCDRGQSRCHSLTCPALTCQTGQRRVRRPGQCCEECVWPKGSCLYEGTVRYHGDMWNGSAISSSASGSGCEFCSCDRGQVLCQRADCEQVQCPQGSELLFEKGKCCPVCSSEKPGCVHHGRTYKALSRWSDGACRQCECRGGHVTCYVRSCPTLRCHSDCASCSGRPDHCESCSDPKAVLHMGRCLSLCPSGFYRDKHVCTAIMFTYELIRLERCELGTGVFQVGNIPAPCGLERSNSWFETGTEINFSGGVVKIEPAKNSEGLIIGSEMSCAPSCLSCSGPAHCDSCGLQEALLSPDRLQCVSACPSGSYQHDHTHCRECHSSCSECLGPSEADCVSCSHLSSLLKLGRCVSQCGPGFYSQDNNCYACDPSCESCFPDKPLCTSCPPGAALHHGKCISECPPQHYKDSHSRCRACHSSCSSCWGPSVSQCSDCLSGLFLQQGQCVETCGEGMYPQHQTCHNCHPSCRSCVGPLASDCVLCLKPEQVLVPQYHSSQHGICAAKCPKFSFTDQQHVCRDCDSSCLQCTGPSSDSCVSCPSLSSLLQGRCVSQCPEGRYSEDGVCQECSADCQRCTADLRAAGGSVCLWCKAPRTWLLGDHCVSECPVGHFGRHGACVECHSSCESCSGAGALSCTSCPAPSVLLRSGQCALSCPQGFYQDSQRTCLECDPQCLTCTAPGACTACRDPNKVLQFGECQYESCAHQYYLNTTTRTCRECDWSCNSCRGPLRTDCVQCMEGHVLQDGLCSQQCSSGFYREGDHCLACDPDCEHCLGPAQCQRCVSPLVVLGGLCVQHCGPLHYLDTDAQVCKPCSSDCVVCEGVGQCRACAEGSFLIQGYCAPDCGHGFYSDANTRTCHVNVHPPRLHDSAPRLLHFELQSAPSNGQLFVRSGADEETPLKPGDRFSPEQLSTGRVVFRHQQDKPSPSPRTSCPNPTGTQVSLCVFKPEPEVSPPTH
ncbi:hypothetical protein WMY93_004645 [Mugilogobius chulae]|uniref:VWFC domain-containing protein n=1 Tax=Mugilogobius chulae TaxID=88201 RepID=A0AAW0PRR4_9GOBI